MLFCDVTLVWLVRSENLYFVVYPDFAGFGVEAGVSKHLLDAASDFLTRKLAKTLSDYAEDDEVALGGA